MKQANKSLLFFLVAVALLVVIIEFEPPVSRPQAGTPVSTGTPPLPLLGSRLWTRWTSPTAGWTAEVAEVSTLEQYIDIKWTLGGGIGKRQRCFLPYFPTEVVKGLSPDSVLIAGKMETGPTVIELVQLNVPLLIPQNGAASIVVPQPAGPRSYVFNEATAGKDGILFMHPMLPDKTKFLVQFYDSRDVYRFDSADHSLSLVASPIPQSAPVPVVPELNSDFYEILSGTHVALGATYRFTGDSVPGILLLIDSGSDGSIDTYQYYADYGAYCAAGMHDANNYTDL